MAEGWRAEAEDRQQDLRRCRADSWLFYSRMPATARARSRTRQVVLQPEALVWSAMDENRARRVVDALRERGVPAHLERASVYQFGVRVMLPDGRQAIWDTDGTAGLEAQVMRDGVLVGFVPVIESSDTFDEAQVVDAIARTDYDQPIARQRATAPPPAAPLPPEGGFFRRFRNGFRER